jgi:LemA protein
MSAAPFAALGVAAVAVFWSLGAYNRLLALRKAIAAAWQKVDEAQRARTEAGTPLLATLREPLAAERGALDALQSQLDGLTRAAATMSARPVVESHAAAWVAAETQVAAAASRVFALLEHNPELNAVDPVAACAAKWRDAETRLAFARHLFNDASESYNDAIELFPTRLLLPVYRFGRAGRL